MTIANRLSKLERLGSGGRKVVILEVTPNIFDPEADDKCREAKVTWPDGERIVFRGSEDFSDFKRRAEHEGMTAAISHFPHITFLPPSAQYV